ncbi:hypothetical protein Xmau_04515 [Xenorhabdus mauleonii]|uniref:DUF7424 domain-containing protein n=1 Tax=Xenorhabdus mauleonii TaxID=351675 RepID=A0A1I3YM22_9GAMM|nr:hypothetical protein [Xenorhabdus mauleonii]PHM33556.1 hypothetical protein Xmau_04515 [Xenorhabdus mauleonii]SFK32409.1 hypothetical protein SAMN05421680_1593 [Xenorhabdus mauleonii]
MKKWLVAAASVLVLSGCKVDVETKVNTDDLTSVEHKLVQGDINVEVSSCANYDDSRQESKDLINLKQKIPTIFTEAKYVECYRKNFDSYAHFTIPVAVGVLPDGGQLGSKADVFILSHKEAYAGAVIPKNVLAKIKKAQKDMMGKLDIRMSVILEKGAKPVPTLISLGTYMTSGKNKDYPLVANGVNLAKEMKFRLSDVSNTALSNGEFVPFLVTPDYFNSFRTDKK